MDPKSGDGAIAFVCAMPMELAPLMHMLSLTEREVNGAKVHSGTLDGRDVVAIVTGMGTQFATDGTTRLLDAVAVRWVLVVGITGALESETPIGTLVWPEIVRNSETGADYRPTPLGDRAPHGTMWTTNGLTTNLDDLARLRAEGVVSLDMETAAIAEVCGARDPVVGVPLHLRSRRRRERRRRGLPPQQSGRHAEPGRDRKVLRRPPGAASAHGPDGRERRARHAYCSRCRDQCVLAHPLRSRAGRVGSKTVPTEQSRSQLLGVSGGSEGFGSGVGGDDGDGFEDAGDVFLAALLGLGREPFEHRERHEVDDGLRSSTLRRARATARARARRRPRRARRPGTAPTRSGASASGVVAAATTNASASIAAIAHTSVSVATNSSSVEHRDRLAQHATRPAVAERRVRERGGPNALRRVDTAVLGPVDQRAQAAHVGRTDARRPLERTHAVELRRERRNEREHPRIADLAFPDELGDAVDTRRRRRRATRRALRAPARRGSGRRTRSDRNRFPHTTGQMRPRRREQRGRLSNAASTSAVAASTDSSRYITWARAMRAAVDRCREPTVGGVGDALEQRAGSVNFTELQVCGRVEEIAEVGPRRVVAHDPRPHTDFPRTTRAPTGCRRRTRRPSTGSPGRRRRRPRSGTSRAPRPPADARDRCARGRNRRSPRA